jgi:hypothetical protein
VKATMKRLCRAAERYPPLIVNIGSQRVGGGNSLMERPKNCDGRGMPCQLGIPWKRRWQSPEDLFPLAMSSALTSLMIVE